MLKRAPVFTDPDEGSPVIIQKPKIWETMKTRSIFGILMILAMSLVLLCGPLIIIVSMAIVQTLVFKEVISIAHIRSKEKRLPWFRSLNWYALAFLVQLNSRLRYFLFCSNYFLYGESLMHHFKQRIYVDAFLSSMASHHHFISFCFYMIGIPVKLSFSNPSHNQA